MLIRKVRITKRTFDYELQSVREKREREKLREQRILLRHETKRILTIARASIPLSK